MRPGRAIRFLFGLLFVASMATGCGEPAKDPNVDAEGKAISAPPPPGRKTKAAEKMKNAMPHL